MGSWPSNGDSLPDYRCKDLQKLKTLSPKIRLQCQVTIYNHSCKLKDHSPLHHNTWWLSENHAQKHRRWIHAIQILLHRDEIELVEANVTSRWETVDDDNVELRCGGSREDFSHKKQDEWSATILEPAWIETDLSFKWHCSNEVGWFFKGEF